MADEESQVPAKPRRRRWPYLIVALFVLLFILNCTGIIFPMPFPESSLRAHVKSVLGVELPASTRITNAAFVATNDPGHYFAFELLPADHDAFIATLEKTSDSDDEQRKIAGTWVMGHVPDWWKPSTLPNVLRQDVNNKKPQSGIIVYYSRSSPAIYLFWFDT